MAEEAAWFIGTAIATTVLQLLVNFDPDKITDWKAWAVGLGAAAVRAGVGASLALLAKAKLNAGV